MTTTVLTDERIESALISAGYVRADFKLTPQALANSRAIEQAVLQSPEMQQMRKDAERYRWLRSSSGGSQDYVIEDMYERVLIEGDLDAAIDAAMEKQL